MWEAHVLTLFPEAFPGPLGLSVLGKALEYKIWDLHIYNIRDFASTPHYCVDAPSFGGGPGMVMRPDVIESALNATGLPSGPLIYPSPAGIQLSMPVVKNLIQHPSVTLLCGRYEGIDQRILDFYDVYEISMGDYIITGGEVATMAILEACVRLLPGTLGHKKSSESESFTAHPHLLDHAHFTRPKIWNDLEVPSVLRSGDHKKICEWRQKNAEERTKRARPDLWTLYNKKTKS